MSQPLPDSDEMERAFAHASFLAAKLIRDWQELEARVAASQKSIAESEALIAEADGLLRL